MPRKSKPPTPPDVEPKVAGHIDGTREAKPEEPDRLLKARRPGRVHHALDHAEKEMLRTFVAERLAGLAQIVGQTGIKPRVEFNEDGSVRLIRSLPREVRELARDAIVAVGIPRLVAIAALGDDVSAVMAVNTLRQMGIAVSVSSMDGEGGESRLPAVVRLPPTPVLEPPGEQVAVVPAPGAASNGHARHEKVERVRRLLPGRNGQ